MGAGCLGLTAANFNENNSMQINKLAKRMTGYYVFQKKIENIFNFNKSFINYYDSPNINNKDKLKKLYIIDYDWIRTWKENSHYNYIKSSLDDIYPVGAKINIIDLETKFQVLENDNVIINFEKAFNNNELSYSLFISNNRYKLEDFDCLIDEKTYRLFKEMSFLNHFNNKEYTLEGIITKKMIILFIDKIQTVKILFSGKVEN